MESKKFDIQNSQYAQPYHHYVSFLPEAPSIYKELSWGLEYYGYVSRVLERVAEEGFSSAAEVGCGDGKVLWECAQVHPDAVFEGYDLSERAIAFATAFAHGVKNLSFAAKDFSLSTRTYDLVLCIETLEHIPDEQLPAFIETLANRTVLGGRVIVSVPTIVRPVASKHYRHYDFPMLRLQLGERFELESIDYVHDAFSIGFKALRILLINPFVLLRWRTLRKRIFEIYRKHYLLTTSGRGEHLVAVFRRK